MHDWDRLVISRFVTDAEQQRSIKNEIICNFVMLNELYIYLRSLSWATHPYLRPEIASDFFVMHLGFADN